MNIRFAPTSNEEYENLKKSGKQSRTIISFYPCDKFDCSCQAAILEFNTRIQGLTPRQVSLMKDAMGGLLRCTRDRKGYKLFRLSCTECGAEVGQCYAKDKTLKDYFDFHYRSISEIQVTKEGKKKKEICIWKGAMAINLSPIDGHIGIECSCGNDTRDFRGNNSIPQRQRDALIERNKTRREFGNKDSAYEVTSQD